MDLSLLYLRTQVCHDRVSIPNISEHFTNGTTEAISILLKLNDRWKNSFVHNKYVSKLGKMKCYIQGNLDFG